MKYLADTHILLWALEDNAKLSLKARQIILDENAEIYYSFVNVWEVAIKHATDADNIIFSAKVFENLCKEAGYIELETQVKHAYATENLEYELDKAPRKHRDPFDRLLLAQAKTEGMKFITHDELLRFYNEECVVMV